MRENVVAQKTIDFSRLPDVDHRSKKTERCKLYNDGRKCNCAKAAANLNNQKKMPTHKKTGGGWGGKRLANCKKMSTKASNTQDE